MELGKKIATYRKNMNITQEALANQLGISNQAVSKWETEQSYPDVELLPKIADIFNITLDELFDRECASAHKASVSDGATLPWEDDDTLRAVLFVGQRLIHREEMDSLSKKICNDITLEYSGNVENIESYFHISCENVGGNITAGGYVECGDVGGSITAGGYVECGDVANSVTSGGYTACNDVGGSVNAGGYAECDDVSGSVNAGSYVDCGDVGGDVTAKANVDCGDVGGNVKAGGNVDCGDVEGRIIRE